MGKLVFGFRLEGHQGADPTVRIWVDANGDQQLDAQEEVQPLLREGMQWFGSFALDDALVEGTSFVVRYTASVGTRWHLDVALDGEPPRQVYSENDRVTASDGRIIGRFRI